MPFPEPEPSPEGTPFWKGRFDASKAIYPWTGWPTLARKGEANDPMSQTLDLTPGERNYLRNLIIRDLQSPTGTSGGNRARAESLYERLGA